MPNMVDYIAWRGDLSLEERPFNDVDNLILAALAYLDFDGIVPSSDGSDVTIARACQFILDEAEGDIRGRVRSFAKITSHFLSRLGSSRRFGRMVLHDYVDKLDESRSMQFSAVQIDIDDTITYVSFRGTDSTLVGWREDFMLSFTVTEAQRLAAEYLENAIKKACSAGRRVYAGGHSKGGNHALYASLVCPEDLRPQIMCVWNNDGPGLAPEIMPKSPRSQLGYRYRRIVPTYDLVGIIFEREDDPRIVVNSSINGAYQHDPFTWQTTPFGMAEAEGLTKESELIKESIDVWIKNIPLEQRGATVDNFFDALEAGGAKKLSELTENPRAMKTVLSAMQDLDDSTKQLLKSFASVVVNKTVDAAASAAQDAAGTALMLAKFTMDEWLRAKDRNLEAANSKPSEAASSKTKSAQGKKKKLGQAGD